MFCPNIIGSAAPRVSAPEAASACNIPTDAEDDCIIAVSSAPAKIPKNGLENTVSMRTKSSFCASGFTVSLISPMPNISTVKPRKAYPRSRRLPVRESIINTIPTAASTDATAAGLKSSAVPPSCVSDSTHEVNVVPRFAPIMTPTDCDSVMIPELTNPTTITVIALEDCTIAVATAPSATPRSGVRQSRPSHPCGLPPLSRRRLSPITFIPKRKSASPLAKSRIERIFKAKNTFPKAVLPLLSPT